MFGAALIMFCVDVSLMLLSVLQFVVMCCVAVILILHVVIVSLLCECCCALFYGVAWPVVFRCVLLVMPFALLRF